MTRDLSALRPGPRAVLWIALATVLAASWTHVAGTFGTLEHGGPPAWLARQGWLIGPLAAVAVDLGLLGLTWGVGARKRAGQDTGDLWLGVAVFAALSALANLDHALSVLGQHPPFAPGMGADAAATWAALDWYARVKVVALSATLPLLAIYLTRVVETAVDARQDTATVDKGAAATAPTALAETPSPELAPVSAASQDVASALPASVLVMERDSGDRVVIPAAALANGHVATVPVPPAMLAQDTPTPKPRTAASQAKLTPARYRDIAAEHVPDGTGAQEADRIVARVAGTSTKTAQRARLAMS